MCARRTGPLTLAQPRKSTAATAALASPLARSYNLMTGAHPLVKITLQPAGGEGPLRLASTLSGILDFSAGSVGTGKTGPTCLQVNIQDLAPYTLLGS